MKEFCKRHTWVFGLFIILVALSSNLLTGLAQSFFKENGIGYYLAEAICKYAISIIPICLMIKWGYTRKSNLKKIISGFLLGLLLILFCIPNILPFVLINPILFKVQWSILPALILAMFSIGLLEESAIRGVVLPFLIEKWREKKNPYVKAAIVSSLLFACIHLNWSVRYFLMYKTLSWDFLAGNLYQVYYTFCFGVLAAGICFYCRSIVPMVFWHGICDLAAFIKYGILPANTIKNYSATMSLQKVFDTYGIFAGCKHTEEIVCGLINLLFVVVGVVLIKKAEKNKEV